MICTRCKGLGFLNLVPDLQEASVEDIFDWLYEQERRMDYYGGCTCPAGHPPCGWCLLQHDVQVCDCCGDGKHHYGEPGQHYGNDDPRGPQGPYAYNGGVCECN